MIKSRLFLLITKHLDGQISPEETIELDEWAGQSADNRRLLDRVSNEEELEKEIALWKNIDPANGHAKWVAYMHTRRLSRFRRIVGWSAAAAAIVAIVVVGVDRRVVEQRPVNQVLAATKPTVLPGRNTAKLTLANGQTILLDSAGTGNLAIQGNTKLVKLDSGSLAYTVMSVDKAVPVAWNILTTPRSGQYQLTLPDGTHVWLNNVSNLRYPTSFSGPNRRVELTGEGYFEIARVPGKPFIVSVNGEEVEVLGTSFNIMAYADERTTQTTLLTGAVRVKAGQSTADLRPDEQAQWNGASKLTIVKDVPSQDIISWKNGFFYFGRASFREVMRQLARWYDVDVKYEGAAPDIEFGGKIDRSLPLNDLLHFLDKNQVHFRLEGRTLVVLPS